MSRVTQLSGHRRPDAQLPQMHRMLTPKRLAKAVASGAFGVTFGASAAAIYGPSMTPWRRNAAAESSWKQYLIPLQRVLPVTAAYAEGKGTEADVKDDITKYISEDKYAWPGRPGLVRFVADNRKEIMSSGSDVLVEFYSPDCPSCERLSPVIRHVAASFKSEGGIVIGQMNVDANHDEEFVPANDLKLLPLIRFFPAGKEPVDLEERATVPEFYKFIKEHATKPYSEERVKRESDKLLAKTKARVRKVVQRQLKEDDTMVAVKHSPCGPGQGKQSEIKAHWEQVLTTSTAMLENIKASRKAKGLPETPK